MTKPKPSGRLVGLAPPRLAAATRRRYLPKSAVNERHVSVAERALDWQQIAGNAHLWEMGAFAQGAQRDRAYVLAGQMGSTGEQLALALAAGNEVALWRSFQEGVAADPEHEMCMRGLAEAQCLFVIGAGHALANVAVWALAFNQELKVRLEKEFPHSKGFEPFSEDRGDWVSLTPSNCKKIRAAVRSSQTLEVAELVKPIVGLGTGETWRSLEERRGKDFHRWRPQTHGVGGVPQKTPWKQKDGTRELGMGYPSNEETQLLTAEVAKLAGAAMEEVSSSMAVFMERWPAASGPLGGPKFSI